MNRPLVIAVLCFTLLASCRKQPTKSGQDHTWKTDTSLHWSPLAFNYLVLKSKVNFKSKDNTYNFTANIRIKKDSLIWLSVTPGMGIEFVRAIITPDSVKIINRNENKYDQYSILYLKQTLGIELDYYNLQNLIVGDILLPLNEDDNVLTEGSTWKINQLRPALEVISTLSKTKKKVTRSEAKNAEAKQLLIDYKDFMSTDSVLFHQTQSMVMINGNDTSYIEAVHQKIEFPTKSVAFPFSVPKKYEK